MHLPLQHGIARRAAVGAESIVVSGGYEDDEDFRSLIIYTGAGGRGDDGTQIADQSFTAQNPALVKTRSGEPRSRESGKSSPTRRSSSPDRAWPPRFPPPTLTADTSTQTART